MTARFWAILVSLLVALPAPAVNLENCLAAWARNPYRYQGYYRPHIDLGARSRPSIRIMSDGQSSVDEWAKIEAIKRDMLDDKFDYAAARAVISGIYDARGKVFYVGEGHHRLAAALEIARETDNWIPFRKLVDYGLWDIKDQAPPGAHVLPVRSTVWTWIGWRRFLAAFHK